MTPLGWCALAGVVLAAVPGSAWRGRAARLSGAGRLARTERPITLPSRRAVVVGACGAAGSAVVTVWISCGGTLAAALGVALGTAGAVIRVALRRRAAQRADARHGGALRLVVAELHAGSRLADSLRAAADVDPQAGWGRSADAAATGGDPSEALIDCARTAAVGHACRVATRSGAPLADVLERLAGDHAEAMDQRRAVRAALAGAHSSAAVLAVLPAVGVGLGAAMGLHPLTTLLHTRPGHLLCLLGVGFDAAGVLWTSRIVTWASRP